VQPFARIGALRNSFDEGLRLNLLDDGRGQRIIKVKLMRTRSYARVTVGSAQKRIFENFVSKNAKTYCFRVRSLPSPYVTYESTGRVLFCVSTLQNKNKNNCPNSLYTKRTSSCSHLPNQKHSPTLIYTLSAPHPNHALRSGPRCSSAQLFRWTEASTSQLSHERWIAPT